VFLEPLLERDEAAIREAIREYLDAHTADELFLMIARFAVMAYAPSQHAKHALLASVAAHDLRDDCGARWPELLTECAIYVAQSRQPWSEPPILDPPAPSPVSDVAELRAAVESSDRLRAERWLAARYRDPNLAEDYFAVAADDFEDLGHKLIIARAAWRLAEVLGEQGRFAVLRIGVWEMCAYRGERYEESGGDVSVDAVVDDAVAKGGDIESMHRVFLFDAAAGTSVERRTRDYLSVGAGALARPTAREARASTQSNTIPIYRLARDYAAYLKSHAVAKRLGDPRIVDAAKHNLDHGISFEEWSFA
jgi:hypothetical protein